MAKTQQERAEALYRIPWTAYNNANGWIEPTNHCQLRCPGCFRGVCEDDHVAEHVDLAEMKSQVEFFISERNVQNISIGGGEPLLYPQLDELIAHITATGTNSFLFTNGLQLDEERLTRLKQQGLNKVCIHIDKFQQRDGIVDENDANRLRAQYCEMFRRVGGIKLGFIMSISRRNMDDIEILAPFFIENSDIVDLVTFTVYKENLPGKTLKDSLSYPYEELIERVERAFDLDYCAYIGKILNQDIAWIYAATLYRNGKKKGSFSSEAFKNIQENHLEECGRYLFEPPDLWSKKLVDQKIYRQSVILIDSPDWTPEGWNLCDGCPDSMYINGKLVPSCLLERVKKGEDIQTR